MASRTRRGRLDARPLERRHMPVGSAVTLDAYLSNAREGRRIPDDLGPAQPLAGFEGTYRNIVDYIVRITHRIWEEGDVDYIRDCYAPESIVFDDYGRQIGNEKIVADTHHTRGAFSDMELVAEDVVWAGDDEVGFHTSHRLRIRGTNDGASRYGPPTGRRVDFVCLANCVILDNDIVLEHVCYNTAALLHQLGHEPMAVAKALAADPPAGWPCGETAWDELRAAARPPVPLHLAEPAVAPAGRSIDGSVGGSVDGSVGGDAFDPDAFARERLDTLWNGDVDAALARFHRPDVRVEGPGGRMFGTAAELGAFVRALRAALPDLALAVDEVYWMTDGRGEPRVAARWSAEGTHAGEGPHGAPSGASVRLWGISQVEIERGRVVREWLLFNELDLMMQIAHARAAGG